MLKPDEVAVAQATLSSWQSNDQEEEEEEEEASGISREDRIAEEDLQDSHHRSGKGWDVG